MTCDFMPIPEQGCEYKGQNGEVIKVEKFYQSNGGLPDFVECIYILDNSVEKIEFVAEDWNNMCFEKNDNEIDATIELNGLNDQKFYESDNGISVIQESPTNSSNDLFKDTFDESIQPIEISQKKCDKDYCQTLNKAEYKFCTNCGASLVDVNVFIECNKDDKTLIPFNLRYPSYNLIPYSTHCINKFIGELEYVEKEKKEYDRIQFLFIVKDEKMGITSFELTKHWLWGERIKAKIIIQPNYNRIEKESNYFVCYEGPKPSYFDTNGNNLK